MSGKGRLVLPGYSHYVQMRGHNGEAIFHTAWDYRRFLTLMGEARIRHHVDVQAWCLLPNEVHLLVSPRHSKSNLTALMRHLGMVYTRTYNSCHGRTGSPWQGPYRSSLVQNGHWRLACLRYIETLPVRLGLSCSVKLHPWISWRARLAHEWYVDHDTDYLELADTDAERRERYRGFLAMGVDPKEAELIETQLRRGQLIGNPGFVDEIEALTGRRIESRGPGRPPKKKKKKK
ncbi:transposase [Alloalcanivorax sp. C16-1]|uniref:transposase n=1 Tax=Alloalcanivorax sp. C16-1 TaxID=3390051 RepID=UPI0039709FDB